MVFQSESCRCPGGTGEDGFDKADCESGDWVLCMTDNSDRGTDAAADICMGGDVTGMVNIDCISCLIGIAVSKSPGGSQYYI